MPDTGYWMLDFGCSRVAVGCRLLENGRYMVQGLRCKFHGARHEINGVSAAAGGEAVSLIGTETYERPTSNIRSWMFDVRR